MGSTDDRRISGEAAKSCFAGDPVAQSRNKLSVISEDFFSKSIIRGTTSNQVVSDRPANRRSTKVEENNDILLTKEELRQRLNLPSTRGVDELTRRRKIPVIRLGHRTVRFSWPAVEAALKKLTTKEI